MKSHTVDGIEEQLRGLYLPALLRAIQSNPPRPATDFMRKDFEQLLGERMPSDLRALLETWAEHEVSNLQIGNCTLSDSDLFSRVPPVGAGTPRRLQLGDVHDELRFAIDRPPTESSKTYRYEKFGRWSAAPLAECLEEHLAAVLRNSPPSFRSGEFDPHVQEVVREHLSTARGLAAAREEALARAKAGALVALPIAPQHLPAAPAADRLPGTPRSVRFEGHPDEADDVFLVRGKERTRLELPPGRYRYNSALSPDQRSLLLGTGLAVRLVDLERGTITVVAQGCWYIGEGYLADDLGVVLSEGSTYWLSPSAHPDMALLAKLRGLQIPPDTQLSLTGSAAIHLLDLRAPERDYDVVTIPCRADKPFVVRGGRVLVLRRVNSCDWCWGTCILGLRDRKLVLLGKLQEDVGAVYEADGRIFGANGFEILNVDSALEEASGPPVTEISEELEPPFDGLLTYLSRTAAPVAMTEPPPKPPTPAPKRQAGKKVAKKVAKKTAKAKAKRKS